MPEANNSRSCVFCGSRANSKEHVFAKSVCERAGDINYPVVAGISTEGQENVLRNAEPIPIQSLTVRCVCRPCNNVWMRDLEIWFLSRLGSLIEPQWPRDALPLIEALKPERHKLAHWLMKSAVTFSIACEQRDHPVEFSTAVTRNIKDGVFPENCWVDLAYSNYPTIGGTITRHFSIINGGQPSENRVLPNGVGFKFMVQFNHLLLRIGHSPTDLNVTYETWNGELPVRLYPMPTQIPDNFAYEHVLKFDKSVVLESWACFEKTDSRIESFG